MWARINLIPLLQAEEDRDQVRRYLADQKREKELLGDNAKVYNSDRSVLSSRGTVGREYANTRQIREADFRCYTPSYYKLNGGKTQACKYVLKWFYLELKGHKENPGSLYCDYLTLSIFSSVHSHSFLPKSLLKHISSPLFAFPTGS